MVIEFECVGIQKKNSVIVGMDSTMLSRITFSDKTYLCRIVTDNKAGNGSSDIVHN